MTKDDAAVLAVCSVVMASRLMEDRPLSIENVLQKVSHERRGVSLSVLSNRSIHQDI